MTVSSLPEARAVSHINASGEEFWFSAAIEPEINALVLSVDDFTKLVVRIKAGIVLDISALSLLIGVGKIEPNLLSEKTMALLEDRSNHWRSTIADLIVKRGIDRNITHIVYIRKSTTGTKSRIEMPEGVWLTKTWFGFSDLDGAMIAKFKYDDAMLIEL